MTSLTPTRSEMSSHQTSAVDFDSFTDFYLSTKLQPESILTKNESTADDALTVTSFTGDGFLTESGEIDYVNEELQHYQLRRMYN